MQGLEALVAAATDDAGVGSDEDDVDGPRLGAGARGPARAPPAAQAAAERRLSAPRVSAAGVRLLSFLVSRDDTSKMRLQVD